MAKKTTDSYYIDQKEFLDELCDFFDVLAVDRKAPVPECLAKKFFLMAKGLSTVYNFGGYSYRPDMIQEALLHCIKYVRNFDPFVFMNPFGFFTKIIQNAFIQVINREKEFTNFKKELKKLGEEEFFKRRNPDGSIIFSPVNYPKENE